MSDKLTWDLFMGFIKIHILHHASKAPIFGQEFRAELGRHGYVVSYGTLYPIFHWLEKEGYLISNEEIVEGKIRKYYSITRKGNLVLENSKEKANELTLELFK
jgi:DNA-binding PadR family transcriptional regulator